MTVGDLMKPEPRVVTATEPIARAAGIMRDHGVGFVPVVDDVTRMIVRGVITDRDIAVRCVAAGHRGGCTVHHHMSGGPVVSVAPSAEADEVLQVMREERVRRVLVTEDGRLVGIISRADLFRRDGTGAEAGTSGGASPRDREV
ncbi:MAG TPA: CBS domain-containing protein [Longimicrobiaceae bacterium]